LGIAGNGLDGEVPRVIESDLKGLAGSCCVGDMKAWTVKT
jgi:hypothetical protein